MKDITPRLLKMLARQDAEIRKLKRIRAAHKGWNTRLERKLKQELVN
jgi:hypothetical protein